MMMMTWRVESYDRGVEWMTPIELYTDQGRRPEKVGQRLGLDALAIAAC